VHSYIPESFEQLITLYISSSFHINRHLSRFNEQSLNSISTESFLPVMQLSSIIFISSTLFFSAFANPIYDPNTKTTPPTQPTNPYTQPASPKYPYFTVPSYECRQTRPTCLFIGPDKEGKVRSSKDEFEMIHINRDGLGKNVVEVCMIGAKYLPLVLRSVFQSVC
jgi:hypothetical protein